MNIHESGRKGLEKYCQGFCTLCGEGHAEMIRDYRDIRGRHEEAMCQLSGMVTNEIELRNKVADLERQNAVMREALEWYAVASHYCMTTSLYSDGSVKTTIDAADDAGERARAALKEIEK